ncbi:MAG TPA: hypothetical protein VKZ18_11700 [Polyangia bacterium]|nr:hypothetical protein [Polyangia bacterium]
MTDSVPDLRNLHPTGARLDALVTGDADAHATAHVASCAACSAYVEQLRREVDAFAAAPRPEPEAFVQAVNRRRAADEARRHRGRWLGATTSALALAACVALFVHERPPALPVTEAPVAAPSVGPIRFKGGSQVAVVVERHGTQSREIGSLNIAPGDRIRVEIALDHDDDIQAGVVADDGTWVALQPAAHLGAGTHFSEGAIAFDQRVDPGWVIVGPPDAVARARSTRDFSGVHAIRIHPVAP